MSGGWISPLGHHPCFNPAHMRLHAQLCRAMAKKRITKKDLLKIERSAVREERKEQGALDGRFRQKVEKSRKNYTRKVKHRKKD